MKLYLFENIKVSIGNMKINVKNGIEIRSISSAVHKKKKKKNGCRFSLVKY